MSESHDFVLDSMIPLGVLEPHLPRQSAKVGLIITGDQIGIMGFIGSSVKKIAFWTYPRTSWQWDVLCVLILVFIFLTPKSWFENTAFQRSHAAQMTIVMSTDVVGAQLDRAEIERRARQLAGRPEATVSGVRERRDESGRLIGYEVDIR